MKCKDSPGNWGPRAGRTAAREEGTSPGHQIPGQTGRKQTLCWTCCLPGLYWWRVLKELFPRLWIILGTKPSFESSVSKEKTSLIDIWIITDFYQTLLQCNEFSQFIILSSTSVGPVKNLEGKIILWCTSMPSPDVKIFFSTISSLVLSSQPFPCYIKTYLHLVISQGFTR